MASSDASDKNRPLLFSTPIGDDVFVVEKVHIVESISELFTITIEASTPKVLTDFTQLMGKPAYLTFTYDEDKARYFSGIIAHIRQGSMDELTELSYYTIILRPTYWMALHNQDYKIYQNMSAQDIIQEILPDNGVSIFDMNAGDNGATGRKYCVRYGESAHYFTSRLMAEEGIFYYFDHDSSGDTLKMASDVGTLDTIDTATLTYMSPDTSVPFGKNVSEFTLEERIVPSKSAMADYDFTAPSTKLYPQTSGNGEGGQVYRFPGRFFKMDTGQKLNTIQIEQIEWRKKLFHGRSTAPAMMPGYKFTLEDHPRDDLNDTYNIYEVEHFFDFKSENKRPYQNRFVCFPNDTPFRPDPVPKPRIYSNQVALVTGPDGEEIHTDEHGRIKVYFYWDQYGEQDDTSSCWVRVSQAWSGKGWGFVFIPRIGMEVIVTFVEGDPDRPMVVGCVYNGENTPPYDLPAEKTKSTLKTNSTKEGSDEFNELRFEDKKDSEQIYMRAQKDWDREIMKGSRTLLIHEGDDTKTVHKGNYLLTHEAAGDAPPTHTLHMIKGDQIINLDEGNKATTLTKGNYTTTLTEGNRTITLTKGDFSTTLTEGNKTTTLTKGNYDIKMADGNFSLKLDKGDITIEAPDHAITIKSKSITLEATDTIDVKATGNLTLQGKQVMVKGDTGVTVDGGPSVTITAASVAIG